MNPNREEALFALALTKPAAERAAWLDRECASDTALRQRAVAGLARAVLGGNCCGGGEGENGDSAAMNTTREERLFALLASLTSRVLESTNPNGIPSQSPGLARRAYPGNAFVGNAQLRNGVGEIRRDTRRSSQPIVNPQSPAPSVRTTWVQ